MVKLEGLLLWLDWVFKVVVNEWIGMVVMGVDIMFVPVVVVYGGFMIEVLSNLVIL